MLSVKQGSIKYHFLSLWYDSIRDRIQVSRAIGEHSNCLANSEILGIYLLMMSIIDFGLGEFYGKPTLESDLMPNSLVTYFILFINTYIEEVPVV